MDGVRLTAFYYDEDGQVVNRGISNNWKNPIPRIGESVKLENGDNITVGDIDWIISDNKAEVKLIDDEV